MREDVVKRLFWGGWLVLLLAACGGRGPEAKVAGVFVLSVDPGTQTAEVSVVGTGAAEQDGARALVPGEDLAVAGSEFVFLPDNVVSLELAFKNVSSCTFKNLAFSRGADSRAVVSSVEPTVTNADLGGGALEPAETTRTLAFGVTHTGKPFVYALAVEADVTCAQAASADLQTNLDARSGSTVAKGKPFTYYANVRNNGPDEAAGVALTVTVPFPVSVPDGCSQSGSTLTCDLGKVGADGSKGVLVTGTAAEAGSYAVSATVSASTPDPDSSNNSVKRTLEVSVPTQTCTNPVQIPDSALEAAVRAKLKIPSAGLTCADMAKLTTLRADADVESEDDPDLISNLQGLQFATNLTTLSLNDNSVSDLGPLKGLTKLTELNLITNRISDLGPLSGLTDLKRLTLNFNEVTNLTPLTGLTSLTDLQLAVNQISDVTALSGLTNLNILDLYFNTVTNISPLVANSGVGNADDFVDLSNNCLDAAGVNAARSLEARSSNNVVKFGRQGGEQCTP